MGIFILIVIIPETVLLVLAYYFGRPGFLINARTLFIYLIPLSGSLLPFIYAKNLIQKITREEILTYIRIVGFSMISLFFNSSILLLWKFNSGFINLLPLFVLEPVVALYFITFTKKLKGSPE